MKKLILIAFLFAFVGAFGQNNDSTKYYKSVDYGWQYKRLKADSILMMPNGLIVNRAFKFILPSDTSSMLANYRNGIISLNADSVYQASQLLLRVRYSDTASMLSPYARTVNIPSSATFVKVTDTASMLNPYYLKSNPSAYITSAAIVNKVNYSDTSTIVAPYLRKADTSTLSNRINLKVNYTDTASMLSNYKNNISSLINDSVYKAAQLLLKLKYTDTASMLSPYARTSSLPSLTPYVKYTDTSSMLSPYYRSANPSGYITASAITGKVNYTDTASMLTPYQRSASATKYSDTSAMLSPYLRSASASATYLTQSTAASTYYLQTNPTGYITSAAITGKMNYTDTASMLTNYKNNISSLISDSVYQAAQLLLRVKYTDTASMLSPYFKTANATFVPLAGGTMTGALLLNADPSASLGAATKNYVDNAITGIFWKNAVRVATISNIVLTGLQTIDGVVLIAGSRVLVKNQTSALDNGIYVVSATTWTRSSDADSGYELWGSAVFVENGGAVNGGTQWTNSNSTQPTIGTDNITFSQIAGAGVYTNGTYLSLTGNVFDVNSTYSSNWNTAYTNRITSATAPLSISSNTVAISQASISANGYLSSTDFTTFNNKQAALTNPITGTGTTNYHTKFTGSTTIGNSLVFDNGTSVGVGTAAPSASAALQVVSTTQGIIFPVMTAAQRTAIVSPANGLIVTQSDGTVGIYIYINSAWHAIVML
jgi:hypothetical protein